MGKKGMCQGCGVRGGHEIHVEYRSKKKKKIVYKCDACLERKEGGTKKHDD